MNKKMIISISVIISIGIIVYSASEIVMPNKESGSYIEESNQVSSMLEKIKEDKIKNDNSDNPYYPKEKEWIQSGPFLIDRSEYWLGEKIFINLDLMKVETKGQMVFYKILNSTHDKVYKKINFDGSKKQNNFYLALYPSKIKGFCSADDLIGEWKLIFAGTNFKNLEFKVIDQILPGMEDQYKTIC